MINLFIFPLRIAFRLLPLICLSLKLALFSSVSWLLLILSLLARLCKTDCQFIMLEIASANWLDKTWVPLLFKWSFDAFIYLTVIGFPWFMKWIFFSRHLSFKFLFTSAAFLRYLSFLAVILDIDTSQFLFVLTAKLMILSAVCWESTVKLYSIAVTANCVKNVTIDPDLSEVHGSVVCLNVNTYWLNFSTCVWRNLVFQIRGRFHMGFLYLILFWRDVPPKTSAQVVCFMGSVKSLKNL